MNSKILISLQLLLIGFICQAYGEDKYKVCAGYKNLYNECVQLQKGNSPVECIFAQDSIECAKRIKNGTADFGVISAESALQMAVLDWSDIATVKELRHKDRTSQLSDFQTVAVVKKHLTGKFSELRTKQFCHPGFKYGLGTKFSEYVWKLFERNTSSFSSEVSCELDISPAELEVRHLNKFFGRSCRPGVWSHDKNEDKYLKKTYPNLCALCGSNCEYSTSNTNTDLGIDVEFANALDCLVRDGDVTYVSKDAAVQYFKKQGNGNDFRYLCLNETTQDVVNNENPCVWLTQPWRPIIARYTKMDEIETKLNTWAQSNEAYKQFLFSILEENTYKMYPTFKVSVNSYFKDKRDVPTAFNFCNSDISWCTRDDDEKDECEVIKAGGVSTGVFPTITCRQPSGTTIDCLSDINKNISDFMGIDSNYGYIARKIFNSTAALYYETQNDQYSSTVVVVRESSNIKSFKDMKGRNVCMPEFGGTASVAFVNVAKSKGLLDKKECSYGKLLENYFGSSCAPGAKDVKHYLTGDSTSPRLCDLCLESEFRYKYSNTTDNHNPNPNCHANETNRYFGNRGALLCLQEQGDAAILEVQDLYEHAGNLNLNETDFRIICRNGSLAKQTGFKVDSDCMLTTIVDGEIVVRRGTNPKGVVNTLKSLGTYFMHEPDFQMFNIYNSKVNLLFKDSTIGLTAADDSTSEQVKNYIELFADIDKCSGASMIQFNIFAMAAIFTFLFTAI